MTREEAIKELKIIREDYWDEYDDSMPALDMAIKALEPCEDAISRKWLIEVLEAKGFSLTDTDYKIMIHLIRDTAPSVIKVGHWKKGKCSTCGASRPPLFDNYCPNCGAKMVEPQESENT